MIAVMTDEPGKRPEIRYFNAEEDIEAANMTGMMEPAEPPEGAKFVVPDSEFDPALVIAEDRVSLRPLTDSESRSKELNANREVELARINSTYLVGETRGVSFGEHEWKGGAASISAISGAVSLAEVEAKLANADLATATVGLYPRHADDAIDIELPTAQQLIVVLGMQARADFDERKRLRKLAKNASSQAELDAIEIPQVWLDTVP